MKRQTRDLVAESLDGLRVPPSYGESQLVAVTPEQFYDLMAKVPHKASRRWVLRTVRQRLRRGWTFERAINTELRTPKDITKDPRYSSSMAMIDSLSGIKEIWGDTVAEVERRQRALDDT